MSQTQMSDSQPYERPVEFAMYHACIGAAVEIDNGIISLLESGVTFKDPGIKAVVLASLGDLSEQLSEASDRFKQKVGEAAIREDMNRSALALFSTMPGAESLCDTLRAALAATAPGRGEGV
jgi:hypothetical protein